MKKRPLNILVTRLQNIGDMLVFVPALRYLRHHLPNARITLLAKHAGGVEVMDNCPYIDNMIVVKDRSLKEKFRLIREFRKLMIDYFVVSPQDRGRVPWAVMGGAKKIVAYRQSLNKGLWKKEKLPFFIDFAPVYDPDLSETEHCTRLMQILLYDQKITPDPNIKLSLEYSWQSPEDEKKIRKIMADLKLEEKKFIVCAPFSKQDNKNWPLDRWRELFKQLDKDIVLLGAENESERCCELSKTSGVRIHNLADKLPLAQSACLTRHAELFTGPDSGPAFMATAVGTPAIVMYGPADYRRWKSIDHQVERIDIIAPDKDVKKITVEDWLKNYREKMFAILPI